MLLTERDALHTIPWCSMVLRVAEFTHGWAKEPQIISNNTLAPSSYAPLFEGTASSRNTTGIAQLSNKVTCSFLIKVRSTCTASG